ncbi:hypothetical protein [Brevibacterium aurantiacum]|uniref:hypothetical protein n=1 Tax=Brevibacterium aurantiacum TaxID=273384 RepID=UPI0019D084CC|nr:hypothetical protein [Brevibacterium aurantiacum]
MDEFVAKVEGVVSGPDEDSHNRRWARRRTRGTSSGTFVCNQWLSADFPVPLAPTKTAVLLGDSERGKTVPSRVGMFQVISELIAKE